MENPQAAVAAADRGGLSSPTPQAAPPAATPVPSRNSLYVGDLDKSVEESLLYQIFSKVRAVPADKPGTSFSLS